MPRPFDREISSRWVSRSLLVLGGLFFLGLGFSIAGVHHLAKDLPPLSAIQSIEPSLKTLLFSADGDTIHEYYRENRVIVPLSRIPKRLQQAVVAVEDRRFYEHYGLDARRLVKIVLVNLTSRSHPGASTLTQQLARNLFLTPEKTVTRKIKEAILALQIEQTYTKDEILTMYLNQIPLGKGTYGVQAAAHTYFGKDVWDCDDGELTMLAGMIQAPARYSPYVHPDAAYKRRGIVLQTMVDTGVLDRGAAAAIGRAQVKLVDPAEARRGEDFAGYFCEEVRKYLEQKYGVAALYEGGLRVTTTLNAKYQRWMEQAAERHLTQCERDFHYPMTRAKYDRLALTDEQPERTPYLQCASLLVDSHTGAVLALMGGRSFHDSKFDRAIQAPRQPGSIFKPFVYLTALQHGYTPASILMDTPVVIDTGAGLWRPRNYSGKSEGPVSLRYALSHSINVPTVKFYLDFGLSPVLETTRDLGITRELPKVPALFLGAGELTLWEVVRAFAPLGNQGTLVQPYMITRVENAEGEVLEEAHIQQREALDPATAYLMSNLLTSTLREGTGARAYQYGFSAPGAGKTGTTNDFTDAWFAGFTPDLCAGVWVGFDEKLTMGERKTGAVMALPIWADFMGKITAGGPDEPFPQPAGVVTRAICARSGLLATTRCDSVRVEVFLAANAPTRGCDLHRGPLLDQNNLRQEIPAAAESDVEEGL